MTTATPRTVAVLGTGDMGSAVGAAFVRADLRVVTDLSGRGAHSRALAARAAIVDLGSLAAVVASAELVLSIVPPAAASACATDVAAALRATDARPAFADCNAVSPATVGAIARLIEPTGAAFIDCGIVGRAPRPGGERTRFYVSGAARRALLDLPVDAVELIDLGEQIGAASALKMTYAALNKGTDALHATVLLAALRL